MDSGHGRKLERYGPYSFIRPEPQAMWAPALESWDADGEFIPGADEEGGGRWQFTRPVPREGWEMEWNEIGRASGRERVCQYVLITVVAVLLNKNIINK